MYLLTLSYWWERLEQIICSNQMRTFAGNAMCWLRVCLFEKSCVRRHYTAANKHVRLTHTHRQRRFSRICAQETGSHVCVCVSVCWYDVCLSAACMHPVLRRRMRISSTHIRYGRVHRHKCVKPSSVCWLYRTVTEMRSAGSRMSRRGARARKLFRMHCTYRRRSAHVSYLLYIYISLATRKHCCRNVFVCVVWHGNGMLVLIH